MAVVEVAEVAVVIRVIRSKRLLDSNNRRREVRDGLELLE